MGRPPLPDPELPSIRAVVRAALQLESEVCSPASRPTEYDFASYLEGELSGAKEEDFEGHLAFCSSCAQELVAMRRALGEAKEREEQQAPSRWKLAAGFALFLSAAVAALLAGRAVGDAIDSTVVAGVQHALGGKATIGNARLSLTGGPGVTVDDLEVRVAAAGNDPLLVAPQARFSVDVGSLATGAIHGALAIDHPVINMVRGRDGRVNIDALLPQAQGGKKSFFLGDRKLKSMVITDGRVRLVDNTGDRPHEVRLDSVDANLGLASGNRAHMAARAGVDADVQNLALKGEIGPWGTGIEPRYRFDQVALDDVPMRAWPELGQVLSGEMSFEGSLATFGDTWNEMSENVSGSGRIGVAAGSVAGRNLIADVVAPLLADARGNRPTLLDGSDTPFDQMSGAVTIADARISAQRFNVVADGYAIEGAGFVSATGEVSFHGQLAIASAASEQLVALAPAARGLLNARGEVAIPFSIAGAWPNVRATVDVDLAAQRALMGGFAVLRLLAPAGLLG